MPLCPRVNDQGDMIRGGNSLKPHNGPSLDRIGTLFVELGIPGSILTGDLAIQNVSNEVKHNFTSAI